jgi:hypothetical protein
LAGFEVTLYGRFWGDRRGPEERDEETLLYAMGSEAANVHLGSKRQVADILKDLGRRKSNWLRSAARDMAKAMEGDWKRYKDS